MYWTVGPEIKVVLQNDIVLSMTGELSIPTFAGIFDGSGFTISNVKLTGDGSAVGLFRYVQEGAKVRNLTVTGKYLPLEVRIRSAVSSV